MSDVILIADDDETIARFVEINLQLDGFEVITAGDGERALELILEHKPALVLLDVMMPKMDGVEVCRRIRADHRTASINVIMMTAKSLGPDRIAGLTAGADDYIIKPFDPLELVARVKSALRRSKEMRAQSPLTGLPGNMSIGAEVERRIASGERTALCHADLDHFKAFNDRYGFVRGDQVIAFTADVIAASAQHADPNAFVGHVGGDDFAIVTTPEYVETVCKETIRRFDGGVAALYDPEDVAKGYIEVRDRQKDLARYPILSISIGVAIGPSPRVEDPRRLAEVATELKTYAKQQDGSVFAVDRRSQGS